MIVQTLFEPLKVRSALGYSVVRTKDLLAFLRRLQNAEVGFSYVHSHILPGLKQSREQHMLNAQSLRGELGALRAQVGRSGNRQDRETGLGPKDEHAVGNADAPKGASHDN